VAAEDEKERNAKVRGGRHLEDDLATMDSIVKSRVELGGTPEVARYWDGRQPKLADFRILT